MRIKSSGRQIGQIMQLCKNFTNKINIELKVHTPIYEAKSGKNLYLRLNL